MAEQLPKWDAVGVEPPTVLKTDGWQPGMKPSAQHMNWLFNRIYKCLEEIQLNGGTEEIQQELAALQELVTAHQAERATPTTLGHVKAETDADGNLILPEMSAANVTTTNGSNVQTEIDNLKSSVSDGKLNVRDAIIDKGGTVSDADGDGVPSFTELQAGVNGIPIGYNAQKPAPYSKTPFSNGDRLGILSTARIINVGGLPIIRGITPQNKLVFHVGTLLYLYDLKTNTYTSVRPNGNTESITGTVYDEATNKIYVRHQIGYNYYWNVYGGTSLEIIKDTTLAPNDVSSFNIINGELWYSASQYLYRLDPITLNTIQSKAHGGGSAGILKNMNDYVYCKIGNNVHKYDYALNLVKQTTYNPNPYDYTIDPDDNIFYIVTSGSSMVYKKTFENSTGSTLDTGYAIFSFYMMDGEVMTSYPNNVTLFKTDLTNLYKAPITGDLGAGSYVSRLKGRIFSFGQNTSGYFMPGLLIKNIAFL